MTKKIRLTLYIGTWCLMAINFLNVICNVSFLFFIDTYSVNQIFASVIGFCASSLPIPYLESKIEKKENNKNIPFIDILTFTVSLIVTSVEIFITIGVLQNV